MPFYTIAADAYDKDGHRINGNTHKIEASNQRDALEMEKQRQKTQIETVRVEVRVLRVSESN